MFLVDGYGRSIQETLDVKEIALLPVLRVIKKDFAEVINKRKFLNLNFQPCARARTMRFNRQKGSEVEKKCRKMKESDPGVAVFPDVRRTVRSYYFQNNYVLRFCALWNTDLLGST